VEQIFADPILGPALFNLSGIVSLRQFVRHKTEISST
jgi:hypothetical protein